MDKHYGFSRGGTWKRGEQSICFSFSCFLSFPSRLPHMHLSLDKNRQCFFPQFLIILIDHALPNPLSQRTMSVGTGTSHSFQHWTCQRPAISGECSRVHGACSDAFQRTEGARRPYGIPSIFYQRLRSLGYSLLSERRPMLFQFPRRIREKTQKQTDL